MDIYISKALDRASSVGMKVVGAILLWIVGKWLISMTIKLLGRALARRKVDETVSRYVGSFTSITLNIVLIIAVLGVFGVQTTSFAAVLAAAGVAIGMAWSGLLANFAAGVFMLVLRPFNVGDFVEVGGTVGHIRELGIIVTAIDTPDNVRTMVGNKKVFDGTIRNFSHNDFRRVDLEVQLSHDADHSKAVQVLRKEVATVENVLKTPGVDVEIVRFTLAGPVLVVRPYCHTDHYWGVYFATNRVIREKLGEQGFAVPQQHFMIQQQQQQ
jgi:small conductance mechanosensitive channel